MSETITSLAQAPELVAQIISYTAIAVGVIIAFAAAFSAHGWGLLGSKFLEGIARQPEMMPTLRVQMFVAAGLMEAFPFIGLAMGMWFVFANPFLGAFKAALGIE